MSRVAARTKILLIYRQFLRYVTSRVAARTQILLVYRHFLRCQRAALSRERIFCSFIGSFCVVNEPRCRENANSARLSAFSALCNEPRYRENQNSAHLSALSALLNEPSCRENENSAHLSAFSALCTEPRCREKVTVKPKIRPTKSGIFLQNCSFSGKKGALSR